MCWALYIASDRELPLRPWNIGAPTFCTRLLYEHEAVVLARFSLPHVIYAGSHQGCGCGFRRDEYASEEESALWQATVDGLANYLDNALIDGTRLELFLCWEGDQGEKPIASRHLAVNDFRGREFPLGEKEHAIIR